MGELTYMVKKRRTVATLHDDDTYQDVLNIPLANWDCVPITLSPNLVGDNSAPRVHIRFHTRR